MYGKFNTRDAGHTPYPALPHSQYASAAAKQSKGRSIEVCNPLKMEVFAESEYGFTEDMVWSLVARIHPDNEISSGSFGKVYKVSACQPEDIWVSASDKAQPCRHLALKQACSTSVRPDSDSYLKEFDSEVAVLKVLRHPHIIPLLGSYVLGDKRVLVLPFYPYCLDGVLKNGWTKYPGFTEKDLFILNYQLVDALRFLHEDSEWLHCDLKPSNALVDREHNLVLCDFGSSGAPGFAKARTYDMEKDIGIYAPELILDKAKPDKTTDIYGYGKTLLSMLLGKHVHYIWVYRGGKAVCEWDTTDLCEFSNYFRTLQAGTASKAAAKLQTLMKECISHEAKERPDIEEIFGVSDCAVKQYEMDQKQERGESQAVWALKRSGGSTGSDCSLFEMMAGSPEL